MRTRKPRTRHELEEYIFNMKNKVDTKSLTLKTLLLHFIDNLWFFNYIDLTDNINIKISELVDCIMDELEQKEEINYDEYPYNSEYTPEEMINILTDEKDYNSDDIANHLINNIAQELTDK